jgi:aspartate kinase
MRLVMKFGGRAVDTGKKVLQVADLISESRRSGNEIVGVFSAINGMTDQILDISESVKKGDKRAITEFLDKTKQTHVKIVEYCIKDGKLRSKALSTIKGLLSEMNDVFSGIVILSEVTPKILDYLLSFGERLIVPIIAFVLEERNIESVPLTGKEAGILTDSNFGEARPLMDTTKLRLKHNIEPLLKENKIPVITGFIGADQNGNTTTLGRGGSDYTATILAASLDADDVFLWGDVDGLMTADPKIVSDARVLREVSFAEATELSLFGAKYMHPRALDPVLDSNIPVHIRNTLKLNHAGTIISRNTSKSAKKIVKSIIAIRHTALIDVSGGSMVGTPGTAAKIFDSLAKKKVNIMMISQSPSESSITMVVKKDDLDNATTTLDLTLLGKVIRNMKVDDDVAVIAVVGSGMRGIKGVAAKVFSSVAKDKVNVIMIAQGSSELNLAFVVDDSDCERAVKSLHSAFELEKLD